jgi:MOSC domain-containing protein YiiM
VCAITSRHDENTNVDSVLDEAPRSCRRVSPPISVRRHAEGWLTGQDIRMKSDMKLISVNVGLPRVVMSNGDPVATGIFKEPVAGRVMLRTLNLDGDRQADLSVHGGPSKAVYAYPSEHYEDWKREFPKMELPCGMFGENFTTAGLFEAELNIGDKFRVGSASVMVTEPRMPCYKLGIRFGRADIVKRFLASERTGFYFAVLQEGEVDVGDSFELIERNKDSFRLSDVTALYTHEKHNVGLLRRAIEVAALPESWKSYFQHRLAKLTGSSPD